MHSPEKNSQSGAPLPQAPVAWSSGLCDCTDDCKSCCLTCWCPCITFGRISEIVDEGSPSCATNGVLYTLIMFLGGLHLQRLYSCTYRSKMRHRYNLKDHSCGDCILHCFCEPFALCQEYRELKNRGFDMKIGWQGNVERQKPGVAMAPVVHEGMTR